MYQPRNKEPTIKSNKLTIDLTGLAENEAYRLHSWPLLVLEITLFTVFPSINKAMTKKMRIFNTFQLIVKCWNINEKCNNYKGTRPSLIYIYIYGNTSCEFLYDFSYEFEILQRLIKWFSNTYKTPSSYKNSCECLTPSDDYMCHISFLRGNMHRH